ncbi:MAG: TonB-dependent receptor [Bacteroidetes bacterium]|nr:TonB-dependent receptor [Bacteroidota bacterium]
MRPNARHQSGSGIHPLLSRISSVCLLAVLFGISEANAQGKIAGRITDQDTGESLIGVNVLIDGTTQGTVTDIDGNYIILNVRPGVYTLRFSYIGFSTQLLSDVHVATGQTTRYDITLRQEAIQGEEIVIVAERPLIQRDLTSSKRTVVASEIEALPVEGFFGVLLTQAGVNQGPGGEIHIRGGRSNEISYLVDGMSVGNPFETNGLATTVATNAIQELTVISGAFNAEYGKAMSGIVNLVTKEGGERMHGSLSFYGGDNVTNDGDIFGTPSGFGLNVYTMEATLSGSMPFAKKIRFFLSGRYDNNDGTIYGIREHLPSDSANFNGTPELLETIQEFIPGYDGPVWYYELLGKPWYEYGQGEEIPGEVVAMNPRSSGNFMAKLSTRPARGMKLEYSILMDGEKRKRFNFSYRFNPDGVRTFRDRSINQSIHWTHTLGDRTFYIIRASLAKNIAKNRLYDDPLDPRYVSSGAIIGFPGNQFLFGGNQKVNVREESRSLRIKGDLTKQIGIVHEVKTGFELQRHELDRVDFTTLFDGDTYREPTVPGVDSPLHDRYDSQLVTETAFYVQDKLEFEDFIINAGIRVERFNPNGQAIPDLLNLEITEEADVVGLVDADPSIVVMPRLGVSFPITERGIIHFSFGHFAQMPNLRTLYFNPDFEFSRGEQPTFGNASLRPERTVQYEMGLQQQLTDDIAFDITGFFKDIRDYKVLETIRFSTIAGEDLYRIWRNKDYANIKGVVFALTKRRSRNGILSATLDYTFQIAEGNNTESNAFFFNALSGKETELELVPLLFDQRHILSSTVTLTKANNWGISLIGQYASGYPYTPLLFDQKIDQLPRNARKPSLLKLDAHLYKEVELAGRTQLRIFARIFNVLDRLNENFVFSDTGRATYSLNGQRGTHATWEPAYALPGIHNLDEYNTRPQFYNSPREIKFGATISF